MHPRLLPPGNTGRRIFLPLLRQEAARSRPAAKKKAPPPKGQRQRI
nr:MAG TPA: hypothetical protein [Caudoviricetes sp.]